MKDYGKHLPLRWILASVLVLLTFVLIGHNGVLYAILAVGVIFPAGWIILLFRNRHYRDLFLGLLSLAWLICMFVVGNLHRDGLYRGVLRDIALHAAELADTGQTAKLSTVLRRLSTKLANDDLSLWDAMTSTQTDLQGEIGQPAAASEAAPLP